MAKVLGEIIVDIERCKGCELCVDACPEDVIGLSSTVNQKGYQFALMINDGCTGCEHCALVCPDAVITVYRKIVREPKKAAKVVEITN